MISRTLKLFAAPLRLPFGRQTVPFYRCAFLKEKQEQDKLQILQKMDILYQASRKDVTKLGDLEMMVRQINPYIKDLNVRQYFEVLKLVTESELIDEKFADKFLDRAFYFFDMRLITQDQYLAVISFLLKYDFELYEDTINLIVSAIEKIDTHQIRQGSLVNFISIVATIKVYDVQFDQKLVKRIEELLTDQLDELNPNAIGEISSHCALLKIESKDFWEMIENFLVLKAMKIETAQFVVAATGLFMMEKYSTPYYWTFFFDHIAKVMDQISVDELTQSMMLIGKSDKEPVEFVKKAEQKFINEYSQFDEYNKIQMYSCFARIQRGDAIWKKFQLDLNDLLKVENVHQVGYLIGNLMEVKNEYYFKIFTTFDQETQDQMEEYLVKNANQMDPDLKEQILEQMNNNEIENPRIRQALEPQI